MMDTNSVIYEFGLAWQQIVVREMGFLWKFVE